MIKERIIACLMNHKHHTLKDIARCTHRGDTITDAVLVNTRGALIELIREKYVIVQDQIVNDQSQVTYYGTSRLYSPTITEASDAIYDTLKTMAPGLKAPRSYGATFMRMLESRGFTVVKKA